ncbi:MAG: hypothetical protein CMJ47_08240 [Planctomyces sp.]|nr:hypothetical protein [Planctomyces sp.]
MKQKTFELLWRVLYRTVIAIALLVFVPAILLGIGMFIPYPQGSSGFTTVTPEAESYTLSGSFPPGAYDVRYGRSARGMGGRLLVYRFSAPLNELHDHAVKEMHAKQTDHRDHFEIEVARNEPSPFSEQMVEFDRDMRLDTSWILPEPDATGTIYRPKDGLLSHRPVIFVDETNEIVYLRMTD